MFRSRDNNCGDQKIRIREKKRETTLSPRLDHLELANTRLHHPRVLRITNKISETSLVKKIIQIAPLKPFHLSNKFQGFIKAQLHPKESSIIIKAKFKIQK